MSCIALQQIVISINTLAIFQQTKTFSFFSPTFLEKSQKQDSQKRACIIISMFYIFYFLHIIIYFHFYVCCAFSTVGFIFSCLILYKQTEIFQNHQMEVPIITQKKNTFKFQYLDSEVILSGDFDSGNLNNAYHDVQTNQIVLIFGRDKQIKPSSKTWFYFSIQAKSAYLPVKLYLQKTNTLNVVSKIFDLYRPVLKVEGGQWERYHSPVQFQSTPENDTNFRMTIDIYSSKKVYVAITYPWSVAENEEYLNKITADLTKREDIYFNKEILIYTPRKLPVHLLAISSPDVRYQPPEEYIEHLFPLRQQQTHFKRVSKPMVLVTARVHPSETGSSFSLMGMIDFLISGGEQAKKMLNQFYFLFVPMLNPDGVQMGNNRLDFFGQNLNRFYLLPDVQLQPSCFAIKSIVQSSRLQLYAFFDLHGHANKKSCFLFGNSINNNRLQTESVLFAKYLSSICQYVEFKSCNFSKKQMSSKDKGEDLSKQGCARVVVHKWTNTPYCYTLETGLFKNVKVDEKGIERYGDKFYNSEIYAQVGWKMLVSLFRILKKSKQVQEMRKQVSEYVARLERLNNGPKKLKKQSAKQLKQKEPKQTSKESKQQEIKYIKQPLTKQQPNISSKEIKQSKHKASSVASSQNAIQSKKSFCSSSQKQNQKFRSIEVALKSNKAILLNYDEDDE